MSFLQGPGRDPSFAGNLYIDVLSESPENFPEKIDR
jgi:hypothetical protein